MTIKKIWYPNGKKVVPYNLKLTPVTVRQWYIGDGCLEKNRNSRPRIKLATQSFSELENMYLKKILSELGFKITYSPANNCLFVSPYSVDNFLAYIGDCPIECYKYKWGIKSCNG